MAGSIKNNADIQANYQDFQAAYQRAREYFAKFEGVTGVGFGQKFKDGAFQDELCLIIFVEEKKEPGLVPPDQMIPETFEGYQTDVFVSTPAEPLVCTGGDATYAQMGGGIQISVGKSTTKANPNNPNQVIIEIKGSDGTLGCIVRLRGRTDRENVYLLSNQHVLYAEGGGANQYVYHPYLPNMPDKDSTTLGPILPNAFYSNEAFPTGSANEYFLDCAIARIDIDSECLGTKCTKDRIKYKAGKILYKSGADTHEVDITGIRDILTDPTVFNQKVYKYGIRTGKTAGFIRQMAARTEILKEDGTLDRVAKNTFTIEFDASSTPDHLNCSGRPSFAEKGDSGSIIIDEQGRVVGLLCLGPPVTTPNPIPPGFYLSNGCCIVPVLDKMNICIPVTGGATMHGTCAATDGSGTMPTPSFGTISGGGALGSSGGGAAGEIRNVRDAGLFQPEPPTEAQQERLTALLDAFRLTARGRELHAAFAHVRREVGYLVRNRRPVTVAWQRNKGPGFFACFLNHLRGDLDKFPHQIGEHKLSTLLDRMEAELMRHGSIPLKETLQLYGEQIRAMLLGGNDVLDFINQLEETESE